LRPGLRVASAGDEWTERRSLEILRFGFELLQKRVALPHPLDNISFAWDKQKYKFMGWHKTATNNQK
jgi:hypothetical protein